MATLDSALSLTVFASHSHRFSNNHRFSPKPHNSIKFHPSLHNNLFLSSTSFSFSTSTSLCFQLCSTLQEAPPPTSEEKTEQNQTKATNLKTKLFVFNLPWTLSAVDIKELFSQCGNVTDVEIIKSKDGRSKGFCFVTMATGEEAMDAVNKFDSYEISGRILRVEFAKRFKKPSPARPPGPPPGETRHVIFATNVAWKARSTHFRDFITENFKQPVSARVVFDSPTGRSAGYAFASFLTKEDAEAAISALEGKELMGRPLRLKFSERKVKEAGSKQDDDDAQLEDGAINAQLEDGAIKAQLEDGAIKAQLEDGAINAQHEDDTDDTQPEDDTDAQPEDNTGDNQLVES